MKQLRLILSISTLCACLLMTACGNDDEGTVNPNQTPGGINFGEVTTAVVVVNPVINEGSAITIESGTVRSSIPVQASDLTAVTTDDTGLAVIEDIPTGTVPLNFDKGSLEFTVSQAGELYDIIVSYHDNVQYVVPVIRYPIGGTITLLNPEDDITSATSEDNAIIFLNEGVYTGDFVVSGTNVLIFGSWDPVEGSKSIIEGNLTFNGGAGRIRGLEVNQTIKVNANSFSAAFCTFNNAALSGNNMALLRNTFHGQSVSVPSSSAVLADNVGIP